MIELQRNSKRLVLAAIAATVLGASCVARADPSGPPNFVFFLADDLGYTDIAAYARRITGAAADEVYYETPHLDRLAREGVAFSQAYATQLCSPTRAALLTGKFAPRLGFMTATPMRPTFYSTGRIPPTGVHSLNVVEHKDEIDFEQPLRNALTQTALPSGGPLDVGVDEITIAEALTGYDSAYLGKWHLGGHGAVGYTPEDQGFEALAYYDAGGSPYFDWREVWDRTDLVYPRMPQDRLHIGRAGPETDQAYLTDDLGARAVQYIEQHAGNGRPFFLFLAHFAVHKPLQAKPDDIAYFKKKASKGWKGHRNATYAAMVRSLDQSVGAVVRALEATGLADNTYVVFMSDNGGVDWQGGKGVPALRIAPGARFEGPVPPTSNAPLKAGKGTLYEGGLRVPLIFWRRASVGGGRWVENRVDMTDIFPTLMELAGYGTGHPIDRGDLDGRSLVPLLEGRAGAWREKEAIYWHYPFNVIVPSPEDGRALGPHSAIRKGDYKLLVDWHGALRLYNIAADPYEQTDLSASETARAQALFADLIGWLDDNVAPHHFARLREDYDPALDPRGPYVDLRAKFLPAGRRPAPKDGRN